MRKAIGIILSVAMVLQLLCIMPVAAAVPTPIFSLELTDYNSTSKTGIKNAVTGTTDGITIPGNAPQLKTIDSVAGITRYLEFGANTNRYVHIEDSNLLGKTEISFEMWIKSNNNAGVSDHMLIMTNGTVHSLQFFREGKKIDLKPEGQNLVVVDDLTSSDIWSEWTHYVITRKLVNGKWQAKGYRNGVKCYEGTVAGTVNEGAGYYLELGGYNKGANLTYQGSISGFKAYSTALSEEQAKTAYDSTKLGFVEAPQTMGLESITPGAGNISSGPGSIEITFDNYIDKATLGNITFTKSNGDPVSGKVFIQTDGEEYTKKVIIKYGRLEEEESYTVHIGEGLKSVNHIGYTGTNDYVYNTVPSIIYEEDFSGVEYIVDQSPPTDLGIDYISSGTADSAVDFKVLQTASGDKYVAGVSSAVEKSSQMIYDFDPNLTGGPVAIELGVKGYVPDSDAIGTAPREALRFYDADDETYKQFGILDAQVSVGGVTSTPDAEGFNYVKVILSKDENGLFNFDFYNDINSNEYSRFNSATSFSTISTSEISKVMLAHIYPLSDEQVGNVGFAITSVKVYYVDVPGTIGGTSGEISKENDLIEVYFDSAMNEESLENAVYKLTDSSGENSVSLAYFDYDESTYTLFLVLEDYLLPEITYTLSIENAMGESGMELDGENILSIELAESVNKPESAAINPLVAGNSEVSANIALPSGAETVCVLTVYDSNGRIKNAKIETITATANIVTLTVPGNLKSGDKAKLLLWEQTAGGFSPVTINAVELK